MASSHKLPTRVFPVPYQVDFSVESKGRHLDSTKRKLTWKFGFADPPSVFPHLYDADGNPISNGNNGSSNNDGATTTITPSKKGIECRGREHEIVLTWSLLTGKAHIYVDSREIYRHEPIEDSIFNPFSASFHRGFDLPNPKFNGRHRIDIRCYARTPMGAKNMVVDNQGGKFRQYDLTVDGLSYFSFPAMYELGTDRMWTKVSRWGLNRQESLDADIPSGGGMHGEHHSRRDEPRGRMVDEYYFDKKNRKKDPRRFGDAISSSEYKAMNPKNESEEERMMRVAMEASLKDWERDVGYGTKPSSSPSGSSSEENDSSRSNGRKQSSSSGAKKKNTSASKKMASIGEDNLIDFGIDEASKAVSQITISRHTSSDVSVLADNDDATTASFMLGTMWNSGAAAAAPQPTQQGMSPRGPTSAQLYPNTQQPLQQPPPHYHDPTFRAQYAQQQQWSSTTSLPSSNPTTPRMGGLPSDASFAVPPPPTWDDYNDAFGGASSMNMGASVVGGGSTVMTTSPYQQQPQQLMSPASVGMASPMGQMQQQQQPTTAPQYGMQASQQWQSPQPYGVGSSMASPKANTTKFDPLRADPFAS